VEIALCPIGRYRVVRKGCLSGLRKSLNLMNSEALRSGGPQTTVCGPRPQGLSAIVGAAHYFWRACSIVRRMTRPSLTGTAFPI
jgi:hypothetical protein